MTTLSSLQSGVVSVSADTHLCLLGRKLPVVQNVFSRPLHLELPTLAGRQGYEEWSLGFKLVTVGRQGVGLAQELLLAQRTIYGAED